MNESMSQATMTADGLRTFATAGRAVFTLESLRTGKHYTFRVTAKDDTYRPGLSPVYFVSVRTNTENPTGWSDAWAYLGMLNPSTGQVRPTSKSRQGFEDATRVATWALGLAFAGRELPNCIVRHEGACGRCGRALTTPESIERGIGPDCADKMALAS